METYFIEKINESDGTAIIGVDYHDGTFGYYKTCSMPQDEIELLENMTSGDIKMFLKLNDCTIIQKNGF